MREAAMEVARAGPELRQQGRIVHRLGTVRCVEVAAMRRDFVRQHPGGGDPIEKVVLRYDAHDGTARHFLVHRAYIRLPPPIRTNHDTASYEVLEGVYRPREVVGLLQQAEEFLGLGEEIDIPVALHRRGLPIRTDAHPGYVAEESR